MNDFFLIFSWWVLVCGLGIVFLPLTLRFFGNFFDKGYALGKIISILVISYLVWLWGSLKILPFTTQTIWLAIGMAAGANFYLFRKNQKEIKKEIRQHRKIFLFEEVLFLAALAFWSYIRGFQPNIQGLEKFMDYGFVNSILRSRFFPPADMWLSGETINYYYFGHLVTAVLTKLSSINSAITYNLMMATLFGLTFSAAFCLGGNLIFATLSRQTSTKKLKITILTGLLAAFLLTLGGNLHPLYWWLKNKNFSTYWYPDATRFIVQKFGAADNTIHEFPIYSFVVADLHGHLLNLPFTLFFISLVFSLLIGSWKLEIKSLILPALVLAVFYMTNTWDFPIYFAIFGLAILLLTQKLPKTVQIIISCLFFAFCFSLPFHLHFQNISQGVSLVDWRSPLWMLPVLWGFPLLISLSFFVFLFAFKKKLQTSDNFVLILIGLSWLLILMPEFIYLKDIYIHSHQRANTMFKLTYQSFVMFSLSAGYIIVRILTSLKQKFAKIGFLLLNLAFLIFIFIYPYFAIRAYYGVTSFAYYGLKDYHGLYGLEYLKRMYPDDYQAILWLKQNVPEQPVIVEAVGESYTDFARVSANTGLPAILGWRVHEWLWRGSFDEAGKRTEIVRKIYESENTQEAKQLLNQYQVDYIFLGQLEKKQYPQLQEEKFEKLGEVAFSSGETKIYQLKN